MSIFISSTETITVVLDAAPTNQLPCSASYVDQGASGGDNSVNTNGTTPVTLVGSPASGTERLVSQISIPNADTATRIVTVSKGSFRLVKVTLLTGYQLFYDSGWKVLDASGNFLCNVTVNGGTLTANQGSAAALSGAWPVEITDGTNVLGVSAHPLAVTFSGTSSVNLAQVAGTNLGSPSNYGTSPGAVSVQGVNAFVTNSVAVTGTFFQATQPVSGTVAATQSGTWTVTTAPPANASTNLTQLAGTTLGAPTNYGTAPGAIAVQGVNAFVTNFPATQPVSGTVTANQGTSPWVVSLTSTTITGTAAVNVSQYGGSAVSLGQKVSASSEPVVIASDQSTLPISLTPGVGIRTDIISSATPVNTMNSARTKVYGISIYANAVILAAGTVVLTLKDGSGNQIIGLTLPTGISTALSGLVVDALNTTNTTMVNAGNSPTYALSANLTSGSFVVLVEFM